MIREIINFTENLVKDIPDIMQWNNQPSTGLHIFIDIDKDGKWINQHIEKGEDYDYYDGKNKDIPMWKECISYQQVSDYITMNKVKRFDTKQKIHSCSPFSVAFNFNFNAEDKRAILEKVSKSAKDEKDKIIREERINVIRRRLSDYEKCSMTIYFPKNKSKDNLKKEKDESVIKLIQSFFKLVSLDEFWDKIIRIPEFSTLSGKNYLRIYLRSVNVDDQRFYYQKYLEQEILNGEQLKDNKEVGALGFMTTFTSKKAFMRHQTSMLDKGVNFRFSTTDALTINDFEKLLKRNVFPNPLPIVIDNREINTSIVKIFNEEGKALIYRELIKRVFERNIIKVLPDYYLLFYTKTMDGLVFNDFDFVPLFRYYFDKDLKVENITMAGFMHDKVFEKEKDWSIHTIFDFERLIVREIFNNSLVRINDDNYTTNFFGEIDPIYIGDAMYQLIMKYRKAFYDYIYKSKTEAINITMFNDMMYNSILSDIQKDEIKGRCEWNNTIKKKINIWFSLYNLFNNDSNTKIMASQVTDLMSKMRKVVKGETTFETPEEFAFGAGQVVSYLIDRSVASNKTYAMLEPYLQKTKSNLLQDAIAQTIAVYKHDISTYRGSFQPLASNVLTYDSNVDVKPLLKYFLAGCFCPCVIYDKKEQTNNN